MRVRNNARRLARLWMTAAAIAVLGATATSITSCSVLQQAHGTYNMVNCTYDLRSLSDISVAGIDISGGLTLMDAPKVMNLLSGNAASIPIGLTVDLSVTNPNPTEAVLDGLEYSLAIDGIEFTSGSAARQLSVPAGGTGTLPLAMTFDAAALLSGDSREAVIGVVRNLVAMSGLAAISSDRPSTVRLSIRPSFNVAGHRVTSPVYIPVDFTFGGRN